ncbi:MULTISPECIES: TIGR01906 family membrane protein [Clostridium]|uniref:Integral membrane protein (TIGR01906 family) n=1 Tax=Clostridium beijerinckii TaxID=1520 RepID=A0AAE5LN45_CLOBE|nr:MULTISPECIES: TIGR01906 family membrane protein [Clostridium]AVK48872.1 hypothetical protein AXY43_13030 [Clostridium sp. MF28]NSB12179.1 integral membrane protein (TIGR01906 family) [Clostridium beijerinckii]OOM30618.1 hypothetical protein CLOBE_15950 [Clostridium beijerinckii]PSM56559.1 TIGR01906 family membrane protein [Clostridium diolis]
MGISRDIFYAISIISIIVLSVLNTTSIYGYAIQRYKLNEYTGLSTEILMDNYKRVIYYVQNPFIKELKFNSIPMSEFGRIHFFEVKRIFIALYVFSIIFIGVIIFKALANKSNDLKKRLIANFNSGVNMMAVIFIFVGAISAKDFSKAFIYFHKIFFRNNYWIFDPRTDPIINALPEEFFMLELMSIIILLIVVTVVIKLLYIRNKLGSKS